MPFYLEMSKNITQQRDFYDTVIFRFLQIFYGYIYVYDNQIVHHNPCFNLFKLHNNSFDNQGSKINKNDIFSQKLCSLYIYIYIYIYFF